MEKKDTKNVIFFKDMSKNELNAFNSIIYNIYNNRGVDFRQYSSKCLRRRLIVGMNDKKMNSFVDYLEFLKNNPDEYTHLLDRITINVSEFFRNNSTFEYVYKKTIPQVIEHKKKINSSFIRIWSAGCSTGEEPYSIAIMLKEILKKMNITFNISIFATDIDDDALTKAKQGRYTGRTLKGLKQSYLNDYFEKEFEDTYVVKPSLGALVKFQHHNMTSDNPLLRIDLVFCRNVAIYFSRELQKRVYEKFYEALVPGGYLVAGKTETLMNLEKGFFEKIDIAERIFKKCEIKRS